MRMRVKEIPAELKTAVAREGKGGGSRRDEVVTKLEALGRGADGRRKVSGQLYAKLSQT